MPADIKDIKPDTDIVDLDRVEEFYNIWKNRNHKMIVECLNKDFYTNVRLRRNGYSADELEGAFVRYNINSSIPIGYYTLMARIVGLNLLSVAVKEQC